MITDNELKLKGYQVLSEQLGLVEAERFFSLIQRERFDYTHWRKSLFEGLTIDQLADKAIKSWQEKYGVEQ